MIRADRTAAAAAAGVVLLPTLTVTRYSTVTGNSLSKAGFARPSTTMRLIDYNVIVIVVNQFDSRLNWLE